MTTSARYRFSDGARVGVLLGMSIRQALPIVVGVLWLTLMLMVGLPVLGMVGPVVGTIVAIGRWKRAPLYEVAAAAFAHGGVRTRKRSTWHRRSLLAAGPGFDTDLPEPLRGLELHDVTIVWHPALACGRHRARPSVRHRVDGAPARSEGFPVASPTEQDVLVVSWGAVLAPIARARCPISRVTWQEWSHPIGVDGHRSFLEGAGRERKHEGGERRLRQHVACRGRPVHDRPRGDADCDGRPTTHQGSEGCILVRLRRGKRACWPRRPANWSVDPRPPGSIPSSLLTPAELSTVIRLRSDPTRAGVSGAVRWPLASAAGKGAAEWGPMAVESNWFETRIDDSWHRSFRFATWPMLPVAADWMNPLLTVDNATRTVTVVLEPVPLVAAAQDANRQLTSIEADQQQKEQHGFRLTARERRRHADVETRESVSSPKATHCSVTLVSSPSPRISTNSRKPAPEWSRRPRSRSSIFAPLSPASPKAGVVLLPLGRSVRQGGWQ